MTTPTTGEVIDNDRTYFTAWHDPRPARSGDLTGDLVDTEQVVQTFSDLLGTGMDALDERFDALQNGLSTAWNQWGQQLDRVLAEGNAWIVSQSGQLLDAVLQLDNEADRTCLGISNDFDQAAEKWERWAEQDRQMADIDLAVAQIPVNWKLQKVLTNVAQSQSAASNASSSANTANDQTKDSFKKTSTRQVETAANEVARESWSILYKTREEMSELDISRFVQSTVRKYEYVGARPKDVYESLGLEGDVTVQLKTYRYDDGRPVTNYLVMTDENGAARYALPVRLKDRSGEWQPVGYTVYSTEQQVDDHFDKLFIVIHAAIAAVDLLAGEIAVADNLIPRRRPPLHGLGEVAEEAIDVAPGRPPTQNPGRFINSPHHQEIFLGKGENGFVRHWVRMSKDAKSVWTKSRSAAISSLHKQGLGTSANREIMGRWYEKFWDVFRKTDRTEAGAQKAAREAFEVLKDAGVSLDDYLGGLLD